MSLPDREWPLRYWPPVQTDEDKAEAEAIADEVFKQVGRATVDRQGHSRRLALVDPSPQRGSTRAEPSTKAKPFTAALELRALPISDGEVVRFACDAGITGSLSKSGFVTWKLRLAIERGLLERALVNAAPLPPNAPELMRHVYERFVYLLACRWLRTPGDPAPFTREFASAWCGVTERQARDATDWLRRREYLVKAGECGSGARRLNLWLVKQGKGDGR